MVGLLVVAQDGHHQRGATTMVMKGNEYGQHV